MKQFDLDEFIAFCRSKPAGAQYPGWSISSCALAQFGYPGLTSDNCHKHGVPKAIYRAAVPDPGEGQTTFAALADRLSKINQRSS